MPTQSPEPKKPDNLIKLPGEEVKIAEGSLFFEKKTEDDCVVRFVREENGELVCLGTIRRYRSACDEVWAVTALGSLNPALQLNLVEGGLRGANPVQLARQMLYIKETLAKNPLPPSVSEWIQRQVRALRQKWNRTLDEVTSLRVDIEVLRELCEKYGLDAPLPEVRLEENTKALVEFMDKEFMDFYDNLGKEQARTLRALLKRVLEPVDPAAAALL